MNSNKQEPEQGYIQAFDNITIALAELAKINIEAAIDAFKEQQKSDKREQRRKSNRTSL